MLAKKGKNGPLESALKILSNCPVCGFTYKSGSAKSFASKQNASFMHITCGNCKSYFVAIVMMLGKGTSTVGVITDLNFEDVKKLHKASPISIDELIEGRKTINHDGFNKLFF